MTVTGTSNSPLSSDWATAGLDQAELVRIELVKL
jgi:hypothetical protein